MSFLYFILFLFFAALCAYFVERWLINTVPGDLVISVVLGIIGAQLGNLISHFGSCGAGISLLTCILGSTGLIFIMSLIPQRVTRMRKSEAGY